MYMWLVLSTFLAILADYSLPMRADTPEKFNIPVSSAHIAKMLIKHRSALNYAKQSKWPYYCQGEAEGAIVDTCEESKQTRFLPGIIQDEYIADYAPEGFSIITDYLAEIMCLNADGTEADDCITDSANPKTRYLFTYGDLHEKWLSSNSLVAGEGSSDKPIVTPSEYVIKAFSEYFGYDEYAGYVKEDEDGAHIINYQGLKVFTIPQEMWSVMEGRSNCNINYNGSCIAYVSIL